MKLSRIKEIQKQTDYPNSVSVQRALLQVWYECVYNDVEGDKRKLKLVKFLEFVDSKMCKIDVNFNYIVEQYYEYLEQLKLINEKG